MKSGLDIATVFDDLDPVDFLDDAAVSVERSTSLGFEVHDRDDPATVLEEFAGWSRALSPAEERLRHDVLALMKGTWLPIAAEHYQAGRFPSELFRELGRLGAIGASHVGPHGVPLRKRAAAALMHAVEYGDGGLRCALTIQDSVVQALVRFGSDEQRARWLEPLCRGEAIAAFALTEPDAGSDIRALSTRARRRGDDWIITGKKGWITSAPHADLILVWARTGERNEAIRGFLVERGTPGLEVETISSATAMRAAPVGRISLDQVAVPSRRMLPHAWGLTDINACLDYNRLTVIFGVMGAARFCLEAAIDHARRRVQFGAPIGSRQLIQAQLADMARAVCMGEMLSLELARRWEEEPLSRFAVSLAKRNNCAEALAVARSARSIMGAHGIDLANHVARHLLNLEASFTYGGTHEIHALVLGKILTGESAF
ncbi:MAG TPA: acyl-CoA dehydrogenase family protein [Kofleriaceae bacterium]